MSGGPEVRQQRSVPTNAELAERAKGKTAHEIVRGWLERHPTPSDLDWAADNFLADPEVRVMIDRIAAERAAEALREEADVNWAERVRWSEVRTSLRARAEAMVTGRQEGP